MSLQASFLKDKRGQRTGKKIFINANDTAGYDKSKVECFNYHMYSFDMKNIVPKESLTCLIANATLDESMLWHRRLGHINFKNINKLVNDNL
ncbi:ribonuclease H-like domain-containing protein, partial [Tanacetum coccineum]